MIVHRNSPVLVVDNNEVGGGVVRELLTQIGFSSVDEALNGPDALAKMAAKSYGLVISDWNLDDMDARALLKQIRAGKQNADLPFIAMTDKPAINKVVQAKRAGVTGFINKPCSAAALQAKIAEINAG